MTRTVPERSLALIAFFVLFWASPSEAQLRIDWQAPAGCAAEREVRTEVLRLLGGALPEELYLEAHGVATRRGARWVLQLRTVMGGERGERAIEGGGCAQLAAAGALVLALMIDPEAVALEAEGEDEGRGESASASESTSGSGSASEPASPLAASRLTVPAGASPEAQAGRQADENGARVIERPSNGRSPPEVVEDELRATADPPLVAEPDDDEGEVIGAFLGAGGVVDLGTVPDISGGISIEGGVGIPLVDGRLRATFIFGREAARGASSGALITSGMVDARVCLHPLDEARWLYGCLGVGLGVSVAEGFGLSGSVTGVGTYGAAIAGVGMAWTPEGWFDLALDVTLIVPFNPLEFAVRGSSDDVFHRQEPAAGRLGLSAHVRF